MGGDQEQLVKSEKESTEILENATFPVHKWELNVGSLESENMPNPSKILGHTWNKEEDTLEFPASISLKINLLLSVLSSATWELSMIRSG